MSRSSRGCPASDGYTPSHARPFRRHDPAARPYPLLRDDFVFAESIGLDNAWAIDVFATSSDTNERGVESE
jgi:hypothetical protein